MRLSPLLAAFALVACNGEVETDAPINELGAQLEHTPGEELLHAGVSVELSVTAVDDDGVAGVTLYHRAAGQTEWRSLQMGPGEGQDWFEVVQGQEVQAPGLEYYFKAIDDSPYRVVTYLPQDGAEDPFKRDVQAQGRALPFFEDFEGDHFGVLSQTGWTHITEGFPDQPWDLSATRFYQGEYAVRHIPGAEGHAVVDWLVSLPLDFGGLDRVQATWYELGTDVDLAQHSLWVSTTVPDPLSGAFEQVALLDVPSDQDWARSPVVDLSAYAGESTVYLAWRYAGDKADDWAIDDILVREMAPDIHLTELLWTPSPVGPGGAGALHLELENRTPVGAVGLSLTVGATVGAGIFDSPVVVDDIAGEATVVVDVPFTIDPTWPNNSYVDLVLSLTDAADGWAWDERMVVGYPSTATLGIKVDEAGYLSGHLGVGDHDNPEARFIAVAQIVEPGTHVFNVDITDYYDLLPADRGVDRWWFEIESGVVGELTAFDITWDDATYVGDDLGVFEAELPSVFYLPRPPVPAYLSDSTSPSPVAPSADVTWSLNLVNEGAATFGVTTVSVSSSDPAVTVTSGGPFVVASSGWAEKSVVSVIPGFSVSATKTDSVPVSLDVTVSDEVESFVVPVEVSVPWPVLLVTDIEIDDWSDGNNDGLLDPEELAEIEVELTNVGDLSSFGAITCSMAQSGGAAAVDVLTDSARFSLLEVGEFKMQGYDVQVTSGVDGDDLSFDLECSDGTADYDAAFDLVLGEPPWLPLTSVPDAAADNLASYAWDFDQGQWRSDGTQIELRLHSNEAYNASTLFLELWAKSTGAPYFFYQVSLSGGVVTLRGYDSSGAHTLGTGSLTEVDADTIILSMAIADLGLVIDQFSLGFGAGFCGGTDFYCDHYPDGWGSRVGFVTSRWIDLSW